MSVVFCTSNAKVEAIAEALVGPFGRHIFFTFSGRRAVQGEKNYILYNSFHSK